MSEESSFVLRDDRTTAYEVGALSRRSAMRGFLALLAIPCTMRCTQVDPPEEPLRVPLSELIDGARVRVELGRIPVELRLEEGQPRARSLLCTHQGCEVSWTPETRRYACPCHEALFDENGVPIEGPANDPLRELRTRVEGDYVVVIPVS